MLRAPVVVDRIPLHGIAGVFHVASPADGRLGVAAEYHQRILFRWRMLNSGPSLFRSSCLARTWGNR